MQKKVPWICDRLLRIAGLTLGKPYFVPHLGKGEEARKRLLTEWHTTLLELDSPREAVAYAWSMIWLGLRTRLLYGRSRLYQKVDNIAYLEGRENIYLLWLRHIFGTILK